MTLPNGKVVAPTGKAFNLTLASTAKWGCGLCRPKAVTCIVLNMSVIGSSLVSYSWTNRQKIRTPNQFSSTAKEIYSSVRFRESRNCVLRCTALAIQFTHNDGACLDDRILQIYRREQLWENLKVRLQ
jgi:hypothetical protein